MSHSVGYSRAAELGRIQRRDLYLFPDFPINLRAYKHRNLDSDCSIQIPEYVGRRQGIPCSLYFPETFYSSFPWIKHYSYYHEICSYQRNHKKAFPLKLHFIDLKILSHLQEKTPRERVLDWFPLKEYY